jgi:hypothetical protein
MIVCRIGSGYMAFGWLWLDAGWFEFGWLGWLVLVLVLVFCGYFREYRILQRLWPRNSHWVSKEPGFGHISMAEPLGVHGIWYSIFHAPCNKIILSAPLLPEFGRFLLVGWFGCCCWLVGGVTNRE